MPLLEKKILKVTKPLSTGFKKNIFFFLKIPKLKQSTNHLALQQYRFQSQPCSISTRISLEFPFKRITFHPKTPEKKLSKISQKKTFKDAVPSFGYDPTSMVFAEREKRK